jgi:hypothetical protein
VGDPPQQVNEIRLTSLETPKEVGWGDVALDLLIGIIINTSFVEKVAAKLLQKVYARILTSQRVLQAAPDLFLSRSGRAMLAELAAARAAYAKLGGVTGELVATNAIRRRLPAETQPLRRLAEAEKTIAEQLKKYAKVSTVGKEDVTLYAKGINEFVSESKNASAVVKGSKDAVKTANSIKARKAIQTTDGSTVVVMEHFVTIARAQRLHIKSVAARYEYLVRTLPLDSALAMDLFEFFDTESLFDEGHEKIALDEMATDLRLRFEALIWAKHLGFRDSPSQHPEIGVNNEDNAFKSVDKKIEDYLLVRFRELAIAHKRSKGGEVIWNDKTPRGNKATILHQYFSSLAGMLN